MRLVLSSVLLVLAGCALTDYGSPENGAYEHGAAWSYVGETGPPHWGDLDPSYRMAKEGREQSPVDIVTDQVEASELPAIEFGYGSIEASFVNNGHTIQHVENGPIWIEVGGTRYSLKQFHFHTPSEHTLDGRHFDLETHLVHESADGKVAVVAILCTAGDPAMARKQLSLPKVGEGTVHGGDFDLLKFLSRDRSYYHYEGSFTTPPCTEGVQWFIMAQSIEVSADSVAAFREILEPNNRPVQPLYDRAVRVGGR